MVYQSPVGARDLLPLDVAQKHWIEDHLQQVFEQWGYHRIITSTLERMETLMAGGAIDRRTILEVQGLDQEVLGLRPELTASIARAAVTRMAGSLFPQRLYYTANVFCRPSEANHSRQQEFYQAGVELLGGSGILADAEMLLLLIESLETLGLGSPEAPQWQLILGEAGLTRSLLSRFPEDCRQQVRGAIAHLDRLSLETLPLADSLREQALLLLDLRGQPTQVLEQLSQWDLDEQQQQRVHNLKTLIELLQESLAPGGDELHQLAHLPIVLDLSLIRTFDYYTGLVFEVASRKGGGLQILGQGGRYDELLGVYHPQGQSISGVGFCLHIEPLHQILLQAGQLPQQVPASDWLVVSQTHHTDAMALAYARRLRQAQNRVRVELYLEESPRPQVLHYAQARQISQIAWVDADGNISFEALER
jgi:ATP phosphoribosyltransferase regulatory subunit